MSAEMSPASSLPLLLLLAASLIVAGILGYLLLSQRSEYDQMRLNLEKNKKTIEDLGAENKMLRSELSQIRPALEEIITKSDNVHWKVVEHEKEIHHVYEGTQSMGAVELRQRLADRADRFILEQATEAASH